MSQTLRSQGRCSSSCPATGLANIGLNASYSLGSRLISSGTGVSFSGAATVAVLTLMSFEGWLRVGVTLFCHCAMIFLSVGKRE
jgi:hypothetical protein